MKLLLKFLLWLSINSRSCEKVAYLPGDLTVGGLFSIYLQTNNGETETCDTTTISPNSVMELEAVKWSLKSLNSINFIPGVKLGMLAYPTCRSKEVASLRTNDFINLMQSGNTTYNLVGLIGPKRSSEAEAVSSIISSMPKKYRIPQISYSSTSEDLGNRNLYPNFFRTIPSDTVQMKALSTLLVKLEWNLIHIIYENDAYGKSGAMLLTEEAKRLGICIAVTSKIEIDDWETVDFRLSMSINESSEYLISGIIFIGGEPTAKKLMKIVNQKKFEYIPAFIFSEATQSAANVFADKNDRIFNASKGSLLMSPTKENIEDFRSYWVSLFTNTSKLNKETSSNPWLPEIYNELSGCDHINASCVPLSEEYVLSQIPESVFISYAIKAVLTLGKVLQQIHLKLCGRQTMLCEALQVLSKSMVVEELQTVKVDFEFGFPGISLPPSLSAIEFDHNGNLIHSGNHALYEVYNYRICPTNVSTFCLVKVATFEDNQLNLNEASLKDYDINGTELSTYRKAQCPTGNICSRCISNDESDQSFYMYIPGDLIMITTFPIHDKGSHALVCGKIRSKIGLDIALTAQFVVDKAKNKLDIFKNMFPDHSIGLILIDGCNDPLVIRNRVLSLFRSESIPGLPSDIKDRIIGVTGSLGSTPTVALAEVSSNLKMPHVGCCSTSSSLSDRNTYPYFARVSSPVSNNAEVMTSIAEKLEGMYVQILYSEGEYGVSGKNTIVNEAKKKGICIAQIINVVENVDKIYDKILPALRKFPDARFVLLVLRSHVSPHIIKSFTDDPKSYAGEFQFIASETWGTRDNYKEPKLVGSITVAQEMAQSSEYLTWLGNQLPKASDQNKWLQNFIEKRFDCYFPWSFNKQASRQCDDNDRLPGNDNQRLDPWTPYLLNAQQALLIGADSAIKELCPHTKEKKLCSNYTENPLEVMAHIKKIRLDLSGVGRPVEVLNEWGNGVHGYKIFILNKELEYEEVGEGLPADFDFKMDRLVFPLGENNASKCLQKEECQQCFPTMETDNVTCTEKNTSPTVLYAVIGILAVLLVSLAIVFFLSMKKARVMKDATYLDPTDYGPYLTTLDNEIFRRNEKCLDDDGNVQRVDLTQKDDGITTDILENGDK